MCRNVGIGERVCLSIRAIDRILSAFIVYMVLFHLVLYLDSIVAFTLFVRP